MMVKINEEVECKIIFQCFCVLLQKFCVHPRNVCIHSQNTHIPSRNFFDVILQKNKTCFVRECKVSCGNTILLQKNTNVV